MKLQDFDFRIWNNTEKRYLNEIEVIGNIYNRGDKII